MKKFINCIIPLAGISVPLCRQKEEEKSLNPVSSKLLSPLRLIPQEDITR